MNIIIINIIDAMHEELQYLEMCIYFIGIGISVINSPRKLLRSFRLYTRNKVQCVFPFVRAAEVSFNLVQ